MPTSESKKSGKENGASKHQDEGDGRHLRVERSTHGKSATGEVVVKEGARTAAHERLAGSRAWLALGEKMLDSADYRAAIECARKGLDELGDDYTEPGVDDDTDMKLGAARERIAQGHVADGAKVMLRMLRTRTGLYADLHAGEVEE